MHKQDDMQYLYTSLDTPGKTLFRALHQEYTATFKFGGAV